MLELAVKARVPIINVHTDDVMFLEELFKSILGKKPKKLSESSLGSSDGIAVNGLYYMSETSSQNMKSLTTAHKLLAKVSATLILVNYQKAHPTVLDVGIAAPSRSTLVRLLADATEDEKLSKTLVMALGGCGIKETATYAAITMSRDGSLSADGLKKTRKQFFQGSQGLTQITTEQQFYLPDAELAKWSIAEKDFFLYATDARLRARGLLMKGPPGTGKTEGAKWLSRQWGIPVYRLDIASTQNKYVGESERFLRVALSRIEREAPCIVLVDEVEKVMSNTTNDSSGTKSNMMSQLLWWLQEHNSRVLTVMTTNNEKKIPPELIRQGRIDKHLFIQGLEPSEALDFVSEMATTFDITFKTQAEEEKFFESVVERAYLQVPPDEERVAHALLTTALKVGIKEQFKPVVPEDKKGENHD